MMEKPLWKKVVKVVILTIVIILIIVGIKMLISNIGSIAAEYGPSS